MVVWSSVIVNKRERERERERERGERERESVYIIVQECLEESM